MSLTACTAHLRSSSLSSSGVRARCSSCVGDSLLALLLPWGGASSLGDNCSPLGLSVANDSDCAEGINTSSSIWGVSYTHIPSRI